MKIENGAAKAAHAGAARHAQNPDEVSGSDAKGSAKAPRSGDRVEISDVGRTLADGLHGEERPLSVEEIQTLRERITDGFYDSFRVDAAVAKRIIESGDL